MTDHVDATKVATTPTSRSSEQYVPVVGDRPEGTDVWLRVPYDPADYGPVDDFATDFDHADPAYNPIAPEGLEGAPRRRLPRRSLRSLRRHVGAVDARHRQRHRVRHRELHQSRLWW